MKTGAAELVPVVLVDVLADDWVVLREEGGKFVATSFDPSISLKERDLNPPLVSLLRDHADIRGRIDAAGKASMRPALMFKSVQDARRIAIHTAIVLTPFSQHQEISEPTSTELANAAIDSAYHFPYLDAGMIQAHKLAWIRLWTGCRVRAMRTRCPSGGFQPAVLAEELLGLA